MIVGCIAPNYNFFSHNHTYVEKMAIFFKGNCDPIGDTPIFHVTMCFFSRKGIASRVPPQPQLIDVSPPPASYSTILDSQIGVFKRTRIDVSQKKIGSVSLLEKNCFTSSKHLFFASPPEDSGEFIENGEFIIRRLGCQGGGCSRRPHNWLQKSLSQIPCFVGKGSVFFSQGLFFP